MTNFNYDLNLSNSNENALNKKKKHKNFFNTDQEPLESSMIIADSGWKRARAEYWNTQVTKENLYLSCPCTFKFSFTNADFGLDDLKNLTPVITVKQNNKVIPISVQYTPSYKYIRVGSWIDIKAGGSSVYLGSISSVPRNDYPFGDGRFLTGVAPKVAHPFHCWIFDSGFSVYHSSYSWSEGERVDGETETSYYLTHVTSISSDMSGYGRRLERFWIDVDANDFTDTITWGNWTGGNGSNKELVNFDIAYYDAEGIYPIIYRSGRLADLPNDPIAEIDWDDRPFPFPASIEFSDFPGQGEIEPDGFDEVVTETESYYIKKVSDNTYDLIVSAKLKFTTENYTETIITNKANKWTYANIDDEPTTSSKPLANTDDYTAEELDIEVRCKVNFDTNRNLKTVEKYD